MYTESTTPMPSRLHIHSVESNALLLSQIIAHLVVFGTNRQESILRISSTFVGDHPSDIMILLRLRVYQIAHCISISFISFHANLIGSWRKDVMMDGVIDHHYITSCWSWSSLAMSSIKGDDIISWRWTIKLIHTKCCIKARMIQEMLSCSTPILLTFHWILHFPIHSLLLFANTLHLPMRCGIFSKHTTFILSHLLCELVSDYGVEAVSGTRALVYYL